MLKLRIPTLPPRHEPRIFLTLSLTSTGYSLQFSKDGSKHNDTTYQWINYHKFICPLSLIHFYFYFTAFTCLSNKSNRFLTHCLTISNIGKDHLCKILFCTLFLNQVVNSIINNYSLQFYMILLIIMPRFWFISQNWRLITDVSQAEILNCVKKN